MANKTGDLFAQEHRQKKLDDYTKVLKRLDQLVDWSELAQELNAVTKREAARPQGGRPPYATKVMIKIIVLQQLYGNLSDEETEYSLLDRRSWQQFIELANARDLPDARTIWHFKNQLAEVGGAEKIFAAVQVQLTRAGYQAQGGQMIDATIVPSPKMHFDREEKESLKKDEQPQHWSDKQAAHKDTDAHWTMKHGKSYHGYKAHVNADQKHKLIRVLKVTPANKSDVNHLEPVLDQSEGRNETGKTVFADRGYDSKNNRAIVKSKGLRDGIMRKDDRQRYDQSKNKKRNQLLSKVRVRVEHVFGTWEKVIGKKVRCVGLTRANAQITLQALVYNLRRWVSIAGKNPSVVS